MSTIDEWIGGCLGQSLRLLLAALIVVVPIGMLAAGFNWTACILAGFLSLSITFLLFVDRGWVSFIKGFSNAKEWGVTRVKESVTDRVPPRPATPTVRIVGPVGSGKSLLILSLRHGLGDQRQHDFTSGKEFDHTLMNQRLEGILRGEHPPATPAGTIEWFEFKPVSDHETVFRIESTAGEDFENYETYRDLLTSNQATIFAINPLQLKPVLAQRVFHKLLAHADAGKLHEAIYTAAELVWGLVESNVRDYLNCQGIPLVGIDPSWRVLDIAGTFIFASSVPNQQGALQHHVFESQQFWEAIGRLASERERITRPYVDRGLRATIVPLLVVLTRLDLVQLAGLDPRQETSGVTTWLRTINNKADFFELPLFKTKILPAGSLQGTHHRLQQRVRTYPENSSYDFWVRTSTLVNGGND